MISHLLVEDVKSYFMCEILQNPVHWRQKADLAQGLSSVCLFSSPSEWCSYRKQKVKMADLDNPAFNRKELMGVHTQTKWVWGKPHQTFMRAPEIWGDTKCLPLEQLPSLYKEHFRLMGSDSMSIKQFMSQWSFPRQLYHASFSVPRGNIAR